MSTPPMAAAGLEAIANRLLALDADLAEGIEELSGRVLEVHVEGVDWRFQLHAKGARIGVVALEDCGDSGDLGDPRDPGAATADVVVRGPPFSLLRLCASAESIDGVLPADVSISGDVELVEKLSSLARRANVDWEEPLAKVLGDALGHEVARGLRGFASWARTATETIALDIGEYVREERRATPSRLEVEDLANDIEVLRDDVERLEARIARVAGHKRGVRQ